MNSDFFNNFFRSRRNNRNKIIIFQPSNNFEVKNKIKSELIQINLELTQNSKALFEAQIVKFRTHFSNSNNLIEKIGKNVYKNQIEDSINWHQKKIKDLLSERKMLQVKLEKEEGTFWINRIKRILGLILLGLVSLLSIFIFISGLLAMIYLLPFFILIFIAYILFKKKY